MRRLLSVALAGIAIAGVTSVASAQNGSAQPGPRRARAGVMDTARARRMDSLRVARGDTVRRRDGADSLRGRGRGGPPGMPNSRFALAGIQLTDAEKASVKTINEKYRAELQALRPADGQARPAQNPDLRQKMMTLMASEWTDIRAALTPEHQAQFDANLAKGPGRGGRPGGPGQPGGHAKRPPVR